jgi:hypothetical protein
MQQKYFVLNLLKKNAFSKTFFQKSKNAPVHFVHFQF